MSEQPNQQLSPADKQLLSAIGVMAYKQMQAAKAAVAQKQQAQPASSPANNALRSAVQNALPGAAVMSRTLRDKESPRDEGEWEFKLEAGVLTVIAWNDEKTEAQCIRLMRRGTEIHMQVAPAPAEDAS